VIEGFKKLFGDEKGATMVEYSIMVGFIAAVCAGVVVVLGGNVLLLFNQIGIVTGWW